MAARVAITQQNIMAGTPETLESGWYRFLSGHGWDSSGADPDFGVYGIEDPDWEQDPSAGHNKYQGVTYFYLGQQGWGLDLVHSMTGFAKAAICIFI